MDSNVPGSHGSREHVEYLLRLGDNALVLGQRVAEWCGHGPVLEEDIAMANVALDLVGQARLLLTHAGTVEGNGRDEDQLAFLREVPEFRNATLAELPSGGVTSARAVSGDYGLAIVRNLLFSAYQCELWRALSASSDGELAAIAAKSLKESRYHLRHAADWTIRLGDGTEESHARAQVALDALWPYTHELFETDPVEQAVARRGIGVESATLRRDWLEGVAAIVAEATLRLPPDTAFRSTGKLGLHSEHLGYLLTEMQSLHRQHPGATW
ncbi:MAG: 1,2-phenylacetyl-CoA epoxidase subunit PaaC [Burkholderiales bacterium]